MEEIIDKIECNKIKHKKSMALEILNIKMKNIEKFNKRV